MNADRLTRAELAAMVAPPPPPSERPPATSSWYWHGSATGEVLALRRRVAALEAENARLRALAVHVEPVGAP